MKTVLAIAVTYVALAASNAKADPKADKLFAEARKHEQTAQHEREVAAELKHKAHDELIRAQRNDFEAHVDILRAEAILHHHRTPERLHHEATLKWQEAAQHSQLAAEDEDLANATAQEAVELRNLARQLRQSELGSVLDAEAASRDEDAARQREASSSEAAAAEQADQAGDALDQAAR